MKREVFGCSIDDFTIDETVQRVFEIIDKGEPKQHVVVNVDKIVKAVRNPELMNVINSCDIVNADGMGVVWACTLLGKPLKERVAGIDLFNALLEKGSERGAKFYFLGAGEDVIQKLAKKIREEYKNINIAGMRNGFWECEEEGGVVEEIKKSGADILFIGISSPFKEIFLSKYLNTMGVPFVMGVGGTFDVKAGLIRRAPVWMQRCGLEWFFRFLQEPCRMFRRYFIDDLYFLIIFIKEFFKK